MALIRRASPFPAWMSCSKGRQGVGRGLAGLLLDPLPVWERGRGGSAGVGRAGRWSRGGGGSVQRCTERQTHARWDWVSRCFPRWNRGLGREWGGAYMHLGGTAPQQVDECCIERHDRIAQMHPVLLVSFLSPKPGREKQRGGGEGGGEQRGSLRNSCGNGRGGGRLQGPAPEPRGERQGWAHSGSEGQSATHGGSPRP